MQRELKFRAWDNNAGKWKGMWLFRGGHVNETSHTESPDILEIHGRWQGCTIEQYTGIKDKNGTEIYEGDVVRLPNTRYTPSTSERANELYRNPKAFNPLPEEWMVDIYEVVFERSSFRCKDHNPLNSWLGQLEVIGNIHENPELLNA